MVGVNVQTKGAIPLVVNGAERFIVYTDVPSSFVYRAKASKPKRVFVSGDFGDRSGNPWEISFVSSDVVVFKYLVLDPNLQNEAKELSSLLGESGFKLASGNTKVSSKGDVYELFGEGRNYDKSFFNDWLAAAKTFPKDKFTEVGYSHSMSGIVLNARRPNHNLVVSVPAAVQPNLDELLKGYSVQRAAANPMDGVQWYDHVGETMK